MATLIIITPKRDKRVIVSVGDYGIKFEIEDKDSNRTSFSIFKEDAVLLSKFIEGIRSFDYNIVSVRGTVSVDTSQ